MDKTSSSDELCYGVCNFCHQRICRPYTVAQWGMTNAKVCDDCWTSAAISYQQGIATVPQIARDFGVQPTAVRVKLGTFGLKDESSSLEARRRYRRRHYSTEERRERGRRSYKTERGRQSSLEATKRYQQRKKLEKEFATTNG